jgi:hypothetical protein
VTDPPCIYDIGLLILYICEPCVSSPVMGVYRAFICIRGLFIVSETDSKLCCIKTATAGQLAIIRVLFSADATPQLCCVHCLRHI